MNDQTTAAAVRGGAAQNAVMRASEVREHVNLIQEVLESVMKVDVHYGTIPGTKKPTLYKPGAEKILLTFRLAPKLRVQDLSSPGVVRYRVETDLEAPDGRIIGTGVGECSSEEEKYAWRKAVCPEEFDATPETLRRIKWQKAYRSDAIEQTKQVHTNVADIANTILKMAAKRSLIHVTLTATAASDTFEQDLEDMPAEILQREIERAKPQGGAAAAQKAEAGTDPEKRKKAVALLEEQLKAGVPIESCWKLMAKESRTAIGAEEWARLRKQYSKPEPAKEGEKATPAEPAAAAAAKDAGPSGGTPPAEQAAGATGDDGWGDDAFSDVVGKSGGKDREPGE